MECMSCSRTPNDRAAALLNATTLGPTFPGAVTGALFLRKIATSSSWCPKAISLLASRSVGTVAASDVLAAAPSRRPTCWGRGINSDEVSESVD